MSLEEALTYPKSKKRLIDLHATDTRYDPITHRVAYTHDGVKHTIPVSESFRVYMAKYADQTHYMTENGTPWITRSQEQDHPDPQQIIDYYQALGRGENQSVVLLNWRKSAAKFNDTGHSSLTAGHLDLAKGSSEQDPVPLYEFTPDISGSFYPSTGPLFRPGKLLLAPLAERVPALEKLFHNYFINTDQHITAAKERHGDHPVAHTLGVVAKDSALPLSVAAGTMVATAVGKKIFDLVRDQQDKKDDTIVETAIKGLALLTLGYAAAKATGALDEATGVVLLKEEERGSGILASLVTAEQIDIMEHTLYAMYKTYYHEYNILRSNCADFADRMMHDIGLDTRAILDEAIAQDLAPKNAFQRLVDKVRIPEETRPSRPSFAFRNRKSNTGKVTVDGQDLSVSLVAVGSHSSVLVETNDHLFKNPPIETFQKILEKGLTLAKDPVGNYEFSFQPGIKRIQPTPAANAAAR